MRCLAAVHRTLMLLRFTSCCCCASHTITHITGSKASGGTGSHRRRAAVDKGARVFNIDLPTTTGLDFLLQYGHLLYVQSPSCTSKMPGDHYLRLRRPAIRPLLRLLLLLLALPTTTSSTTTTAAPQLTSPFQVPTPYGTAAYTLIEESRILILKLLTRARSS